MTSFQDFADECAARCINARECSPKHWQAFGKKLVNFYPTTGTIHPDKMKGSISDTTEDGRAYIRAVMMAAGELPADQESADTEAQTHLFRAAVAALPDEFKFLERDMRAAEVGFVGANMIELRFSDDERIAQRTVFKNLDAVRDAYRTALGRSVRVEMETRPDYRAGFARYQVIEP